MNKDARTKAVSSRASTKARQAPPARSGKSAVAGARRTWIVLAGLAGGLACTGALLKALAPPPLKPDATASLFAVGEEQSIERIFDSPVTVKPGRWHSIYVHQSLTASGDAQSLGQGADGLADHFLIGNGDPLTDGAIQTGPRWSQQLRSGGVPGADVSPDCLTICVVGDFNHTRPTPKQQARLVELISALEKQLGISSDAVILGVDVREPSIGGIGRHFPVDAIRSQLTQ